MKPLKNSTSIPEWWQYLKRNNNMISSPFSSVNFYLIDEADEEEKKEQPDVLKITIDEEVETGDIFGNTQNMR